MLFLRTEELLITTLKIWVYITNYKIKTINIMKQLIYYIKLTDGTEIISITRNDAVERINNHFKNENYYQAITLSVFDRLIINGKMTSYIATANKTPINEYYKKEVALFILNDKKQRTDDAMKKAINRYVNKLYHANHIVRSENEDVTFDLNDIKNYYENNKEEVEMLFMNNGMGLLKRDDKPKTKNKHKLIKQKMKTLRNRHNRQNKTFKRSQILK